MKVLDFLIYIFYEFKIASLDVRGIYTFPLIKIPYFDTFTNGMHHYLC